LTAAPACARAARSFARAADKKVDPAAKKDTHIKHTHKLSTGLSLRFEVRREPQGRAPPAPFRANARKPIGPSVWVLV
jgi:hypothetical protein